VIELIPSRREVAFGKKGGMKRKEASRIQT
jgi:hypothetical protein